MALYILHQIVQASRRGIPILIDAERKRDGLDELLSFANYVVCSAKFPQIWTEASSPAKALLSIMLRLPKLKFVIVTLGEEGCVMLERWLNKAPDSVEMDIEELLESLKWNISDDSTTPSCVSSSVMNLRADGVGMLCGRLHVGTSEKIPPSELVDTTGAGDAFTGGENLFKHRVHRKQPSCSSGLNKYFVDIIAGDFVALCADMPPERMLPFAAQVAACGCRGLGARSSLPHRSDPRLAPYLMEGSKIAATML
ncbi:hypothetical protein Cgig2_010402 [Carnegiea gigantea]|uniref:Carbohydrate kinase PfkB domain-containing protein n=1 Tax=Carnegiea gigantea TaxID=171969 RepID=A0A9Q1JLQ1_9CARY|nr:hypothetical protein Cgig2_010402 [Carnegiea gigantea]